MQTISRSNVGLKETSHTVGRLQCLFQRLAIMKHFRLWGCRDKDSNNSWVCLENTKIDSLKAKETGALKPRDNRSSKMRMSIL